MNIDRSNIKKILVIQLRPFGDVLLATSYLQALHENFPLSTIDFLVCDPFQNIIKGHPFLTEILVSAKREENFLQYCFGRISTMVRVFRRKYDLVIDQQAGTGSAILTLFSCAKYRLGWEDAKGRFSYSLRAVPGKSRYHGCRNFDMLAPLGIKERAFQLYVPIEGQSRDFVESWLCEKGIVAGKFICIAPGSPDPRKRWSLECFQGLVSLIKEKANYDIVLCYSPNEEPVARLLAEMSSGRATLGPRTTFNQVAALLTLCRLLICHDGALNHLSVATKTPAIAIFGSSAASAWSPQGVFADHYHVQKNFDKDDTTFGISPQDVFDKVTKVLALP